jgi:hypothetical protein
MCLRLPNITNPKYIQYLIKLILSPIRNVVGICKLITILIFKSKF